MRLEKFVLRPLQTVSASIKDSIAINLLIEVAYVSNEFYFRNIGVIAKSEIKRSVRSARSLVCQIFDVVNEID